MAGDRSDEGHGEAPAKDGAAADERGVGTFLYRMALAGVGALVLAQEEIENRLKKLRGRSAPEGAEPAPDPEPAAEQAANEARSRKTLAEHIDGTVNRVLHSLHVPTRGDLDDLSKRVEELTRKVGSLRK